MSGNAGVPVVEGTVDAIGATLAYRRYGTGLGEPLVLVHGARMDGRVWARAVPALARAHDVVVPDLRGRGRSTCDTAVPASFVADVLLLIERLGLDRIHLVGHSMGGGLALELAWRLRGDASHPLVTLTLVAPTPTAGWQPGPGVLAFSEQLAQRVAAGEREAAFETVLTHLWLSDGRPRSALEQQAVKHARTVFLDNLDPPWPPALEESHPEHITDYARIDVPTLILTGEADLPDVRDVASALTSIVPRASLVRLPHCGHDIASERPDELAALILQHVATDLS